MIALTFFPSLRNAQGQRVRTTWPKLVARLSEPKVADAKEDVAGLSLATYAGDRRALANVEHVYAVGLDLDEGVTWSVVRERFAGCASFVHSTWSSTLLEPRARVFLPLSRPVTGDEYRRVYAAVASKVEAGGLVVDRKASDPSRFWFLPATRPGAPFTSYVGDGAPVSVEAALEAVPPPVAFAPPPPSSPRVRSAGDVESRAAAYLAKCGPAVSGQGGHTTTFLVAQKLVLGFSLDEETAFRLLAGWNQQCQPPWSERELRRKIRQAIQRGVVPEGSLRDRRAG